MSSPPDEKRPPEKPAVRTTIVGGRPPGPGTSIGSIPYGMEILIKKAAVDPAFKSLLLEKRAEAAAEIEGLVLEPAEAAMLNTVPVAQLEAIIAKTKVPEDTRRGLLGKVTLSALVALGVVVLVRSCASSVVRTRGISPDHPSTEGIRPDRTFSAGVRARDGAAPESEVPLDSPTTLGLQTPDPVVEPQLDDQVSQQE